mmetsp:Transcript_7354/g.13573  ORF Transcript_7354/g.13573 Transcript_7354/m.13573 type:complete len:268 (-) Transcript_7354:128-931(-)
MDHNHNANSSRCDSPRVLPHVVLALVFSLVDNVKHLGKVLAKAMRCCPLHTSTICRNKRLNSSCVERPRKLFFLRLSTLHDWHCKELFVHLRVQIKNIKHFVVSFCFCCKSGVTLLPKEFSASYKRSWVLELPANDVTPLIQTHWQVSVAADPGCVKGVHDSLTCWTDRNRNLQVCLARLCYPGNLRSKVLHVVLLLVQDILGDEHGEVAVVNAKQLDLGIKPLVDMIPDVVGPGPKNVAAGDLVITNHLTLCADLRVPVTEFFSFL